MLISRVLTIAVAVVVLILAGLFAIPHGFSPGPKGTTYSMQSGSDSITFSLPKCSTPCAVWREQGGSNPASLAVAPDNSFVAMGNGSGIYLLDYQGHLLWSKSLNHQVSSISLSSNGQYIAAGAWQIKGGCAPNLNITGPHSCPAAVYANGMVYLFDSRSGKLLWSVSTGSSNPVFKVKISADGSKIAVDTENSIMYLDGTDGSTIWTRDTGGDLAGMDMSSDGQLVVVSMGPIMAFDGQGHVIWSHPAQDLAVSTNAVAMSANGSRIWVGSAVSGYNGTLYLFNRQGTMLSQRQIYSPALSIQSGGNMTAFVSTNWGGLLYHADGSLLLNMTSSATPAQTGCRTASFWYWSGNQSPVAFIDTQGMVVSSYSPGGFTANAALSQDGHFAAVISDLGSRYTLAFVFLGQSGCVHA